MSVSLLEAVLLQEVVQHPLQHAASLALRFAPFGVRLLLHPALRFQPVLVRLQSAPGHHPCPVVHVQLLVVRRAAQASHVAARLVHLASRPLFHPPPHDAIRPEVLLRARHVHADHRLHPFAGHRRPGQHHAVRHPQPFEQLRACRPHVVPVEHHQPRQPLQVLLLPAPFEHTGQCGGRQRPFHPCRLPFASFGRQPAVFLRQSFHLPVCAYPVHEAGHCHLHRFLVIQIAEPRNHCCLHSLIDN